MLSTKDIELNRMISKDSDYQKLLQECYTVEPEYLRILHTLPVADREYLERYISLCEELDHRSLTLALTI